MGKRQVVLFAAIEGVMLLVGIWLAPRALGFIYHLRGVRYLERAMQAALSDSQTPFTCEAIPVEDQATLSLAEKALTSLSEAQYYAPYTSHTYLALGRAYCLLGQPERAVQHYQIYTLMRPDNPLGHLELGFAYEAMCKTANKGDGVSLKSSFGQLHCTNNSTQASMLTEWESGENAQDFLEVGKQLQSSGRYQEALTWYQRVTWLEPSWGSPWYYIGLTLEKLEDTEGALSAYERSVQLSPHNIEPYYALGDLLTNRLKDYNKALEVYQVVSKLDPLPIQAYIDIGDTLEKIGQKEQSLLAYQEAVRQSEQINGNSNVDYRNRVWPLYILGDYYLRMGSLEDATNYFHQALAKDPNQWFAGWSLWGLGRIELQKERFDEAGSELFQALELASNFYLRSQIYLNIGEVYINQGKIDIGIEYLRKAHIEHPDNRGLHLFLAETLRDAGYLKEAILEYENYLKKWPDDNNALHALQETQDMLATQHP